MLEKYGVHRYAKTEEFRSNYSGLKNGTYSHFKNFENFNDEFIKSNFVNESVFNLVGACEFFNCTVNTFRGKNYYNSDPRIGRKIEDNFRVVYRNTFRYNTRKIISPKEIDMFSDEFNFGIEYNGLYWHSDLFKNKTYHLDKTNSMEDKGYQLFHIFENEWLEPNKRQIWKSVINSKLNKTNRVFARKCDIKELNSNESNHFIEQNQLQGKCAASIRLGLYYQNELVSVMSFGKSRYNKSVQYELIRFCSLLNTTVVGGASKLLKYFELNYKPESIISYANRRWSTGNLYEILGFEFVRCTKPNYFYFRANENKLYSREQFQKHKLKEKLKLFDSELTEIENMYNNKYRKIYDSGNKTYIKEYK